MKILFDLSITDSRFIAKIVLDMLQVIFFSLICRCSDAVNLDILRHHFQQGQAGFEVVSVNPYHLDEKDSFHHSEDSFESSEEETRLSNICLEEPLKTCIWFINCLTLIAWVDKNMTGI